MKEYFKIGKINYEGPKSTNPFSFKYYNKDEVILGKKMSEHLKFAMSWWHTLCAKGSGISPGGFLEGFHFCFLSKEVTKIKPMFFAFLLAYLNELVLKSNLCTCQQNSNSSKSRTEGKPPFYPLPPNSESS